MNRSQLVRRNRQFRAPAELGPSSPIFTPHFHNRFRNAYITPSINVLPIGTYRTNRTKDREMWKSEPKNRWSHSWVDRSQWGVSALWLEAAKPTAFNPQQIVGNHPGYALGYALGYAHTEVKL